MSVERWIVVRNWDRFQHPDAARSTVPPWIKLYVELLADDTYLTLSLLRRQLLVSIWLAYAQSRRRLSADTAQLSRRFNLRVRQSDLEALSDAGFIEFSASNLASNPASNPASKVASLEKRREEEPLYPTQSVGLEDEKTKSTTRTCRRCGAPVAPRASCKECGATPRIAGTNPRELAKPSAYERARAFTTNVGWGYETVDFLEELARFDLSDEQRADLERLRAGLNGAAAASGNPFIDDLDE